MQTQGCLTPVSEGFALTGAGERWLGALGLRVDPPTTRRRFAYRCLDWSERRDHLAGQLADQIFQHCIEKGWLRRAEGRSVAVTVTGQRELLPQLSGEWRGR